MSRCLVSDIGLVLDRSHWIPKGHRRDQLNATIILDFAYKSNSARNKNLLRVEEVSDSKRDAPWLIIRHRSH
jgi:hypothetical protein